MIALEQPLGELGVVGQPGLPHQRRVRREPRDPRIGGQREDAVEVGPVGEDACGDLVEHCLTIRTDCAQLASAILERLTRRRWSRSCATPSARLAATAIGARLATRLWALPGCSISTVRQPAAWPAATSASVSPSIHEPPGRGPAPRRRRAASPGAGLRQAHGPESSGTTPVGMVQAQARGRRADALLARAARARARARRAAARPRPCPWPPPAGWRRTPARTPPAPAPARPPPRPGAGARPRPRSGDSGTPERVGPPR